MLERTFFPRLILRFALVATGVLVLLIAPLLVIARQQPDPGQMVFWMNGRFGQALYVIDTRRLMWTRLNAPPPYAVVETPHLSQNGQRAVFGTVDRGQLSIYVKDIQRGIIYITDSRAEDRLAALSPDGQRVAYWSSSENRLNTRFQNWHLMIRDIDTGAARIITQQLAVIPYDRPLWSPDGRRLIVRFWEGGEDAGTHIIDTVSGELERITPLLGLAGDLEWAHDDEHLVFRSTRDGNPEIYVLNLLSHQVTNLTHNPATDFQPTWSPDSRHIVFVSNREGRGEIHRMNADGSNLIRLSEGGGWQPIWSPEGGQIAFISWRGNTDAIYLVNADGSDLRYVTDLDNGQQFVGWYESEN